MKYTFLALLNLDKFKQYAKIFPQECMDLLVKFYPKVFNLIKLKNELSDVVDNDVDFQGVTLKNAFKMLSTDYKGVFEEAEKLFKLIITIP